MRVTTAFNRILSLPGATVVSVSFERSGIVVGIRSRARRLTCPCGATTRARYDTSTRRWRHLDMAAAKVFLESDIARVDCRACGRVRTQVVPWARAGARFTRDFEDMSAWLAQRTDLTTVSRLMRCSWQSVHDIAGRVVAEHIDSSRLDGLYRIGVDEISYRRGHQYLTVVADHDGKGVVWVAKGKRGAALEAFFDALGPERADKLKAVSMDFGTVYRDATRRKAPRAVICFDPFHAIQLANRALDSVYKAHGRELSRSGVGDADWRRTRFALRAGAERLNEGQLALLARLRQQSNRLWRAWELKEGLRDLYRRVPPEFSRPYLRAWLSSASHSRIAAMVQLARTIRRNFDGIVAAVELGLSNALLEGVNAGIRLIQRRGYGFRNTDSLAAMVYLCLGGLTIRLPTET
ncbi:MAG TPA: ISL3 family transposase [Acidimicrobiales bacterium]|nr:ISL3 family transposase [Acidimicrobiales bacterium]